MRLAGFGVRICLHVGGPSVFYVGECVTWFLTLMGIGFCLALLMDKKFRMWMHRDRELCKWKVLVR